MVTPYIDKVQKLLIVLSLEIAAAFYPGRMTNPFMRRAPTHACSCSFT